MNSLLISALLSLLIHSGDAAQSPSLAPPSSHVRGGKLALFNSKEEVFILDKFDESGQVDDSEEAAELLLDALEDEINQVVSSYRSEVSETFEKLRTEMKYKNNKESYNRKLLDIPSFSESKSLLEDTATNLSHEIKALLESNRWRNTWARSAAHCSPAHAVAQTWNQLHNAIVRQALSIQLPSWMSSVPSFLTTMTSNTNNQYVYYSIGAFCTSYLLTRVITQAVRGYTASQVTPSLQAKTLQWIQYQVALLQAFLFNVWVSMVRLVRH